VSANTAPPIPWSAPQWLYSTYFTGWSVIARIASLTRLGVRGFTCPMGSTRITPSSVGMNTATWFSQRKPYTSGANRASSASDSVGIVHLLPY
jgi:hypothetical protein